ncbi:hypothetical protein AAHA92_33096 [Salvia divinorum]|uniref:ARGOS-like protein n=1 Tax=Salvia divinorum TaxID=28513 RepID=A0ABD1FMV6_SALDI
MNSEHPRSRSALSKELMNIQDKYLTSVRRSKNGYVDVKKEYEHSNHRLPLPLGHGKRMFRYFTLESLFLLVCLTVSLLVLPVVLPPLPPPPLLLLLLPILILALLMFLAFTPAATHAYAYA